MSIDANFFFFFGGGTRQPFSAICGPKFTKLGGHVGESLMIDKFVFDCWYHVPLQRSVLACEGTCLGGVRTKFFK